VSKQVGNKFLKFGTQIIREQDNSLRRQAARPEYAFDNILSLANDAPFFENAADINPLTGGTPNSRFYFRDTSYNFFVQNDWKVRKNLTLNLGCGTSTPRRSAKRTVISAITFPAQTVSLMATSPR